MNRFSLEKKPKQDDIHFLEEQINLFNIQSTGIPFGGFISSFVRNDFDQVIAGVHGWVWGNCCEIQYLWVHKDLRGQGYGGKLLDLVEAEAKRRGSTMIALTTHSFQAPQFYQKRGFEFVGVVENYPAPYHKYLLRKQLKSEN
jgi:GNAT superfamily N-acetyltransferase